MKALTEVMTASIRLESLRRENEKDLQKVKARRKEIKLLIKKYGPVTNQG